ncbi:hypothetical protein E2C01_017009 [Portunus trituberculatus]|uniref:Uncharacterized protein n=1 Tax=Portunus trituberculatus TaxID=210409 RepID=A0A5B7DQI9_PORTR|nr:hypothetical protein [Portunus trituberculatus]
MNLHLGWHGKERMLERVPLIISARDHSEVATTAQKLLFQHATGDKTILANSVLLCKKIKMNRFCPGESETFVTYQNSLPEKPSFDA